MPDIQFKLIIHDFCRQNSVEEYQAIFEQIKDLDVSILVNNVSYADGNEFADMTINSVHTMMSVNCYSIALFTKLLIEPFKRRWS